MQPVKSCAADRTIAPNNTTQTSASTTSAPGTTTRGTGRFLLRDPENGKAVDPASLHKYLYAGGDPVNAIDPTGLETAVEFVKATFISSLETIEWATQTASRVRCLISVSITLLNAITNHTNWRWPLTWAGILNSAWGCKNAFTPL